jgi:AcrR family transcriptional regulator
MRQAEPAAIPATSREKILDTAEALFARRGFGGVGLREVARRSGLSKSALFHHFPSKADLYMAVLSRILGALQEAVAGEEPEGGRALAQLVSIIESLIDSLAASPTRAPLLLRTLFESELVEIDPHAETDAQLDRILGSISGVMTAGVESGQIRPVAVPHALQSLIGMVVFHFASGEFGDDVLGSPVYSAAEIRRFKEFVVSFIQSGLAARPDLTAPVQGDSQP